MVGDAREDIGEPGAGIDVVELAGFDQRIDGGRPAATDTFPPPRSKRRPVPPADCSGPSHTNSGEQLAGSMASNSPARTSAIESNTPSVMRVRAEGAMALEPGGGKRWGREAVA